MIRLGCSQVSMRAYSTVLATWRLCHKNDFHAFDTLVVWDGVSVGGEDCFKDKASWIIDVCARLDHTLESKVERKLNVFMQIFDIVLFPIQHG